MLIDEFQKLNLMLDSIVLIHRFTRCF